MTASANAAASNKTAVAQTGAANPTPSGGAPLRGAGLLDLANGALSGAVNAMWLADLRRRGAEEFQAHGLPTLRDEEWRETDVKAIVETQFAAAAAGDDACARELIAAAAIPGLDAHSIALLDGRFDAELSEIGALPEGVIVSSLADAIVDRGPLLRQHLGMHAPLEGQPFTALNTAALTDGLFIYIPTGVKLDKPILVRVLGLPSAQAAVSHPRILIVAGDGSQVDVIEQHSGPAEAVYLSNGVTEIHVGVEARVSHCFIEQDSARAFNVTTLGVTQERGSDFASHSVLLGGQIVRNNVYPTLVGEGAHSLLNGLYIPTGRAVMDNHMRVHHRAPACPSRQYYTGLIRDRAKGVFIGRIVVDRVAQQTDAVQSSRNLLLSENARAHNRPQLEIFADDVKCTHGVTTGELDASSVFYLRSRGIPEDVARGMLIYSHAQETIGRIGNAAVRDYLRLEVVRKLGLAQDIAGELEGAANDNFDSVAV